ncbi:MAG TPA: GIY-YIG nuclease family protein [Bacteroidales bacterium]|nr:GIY-YIG nuclease family protein [Bacteroidales bacterium]
MFYTYVIYSRKYNRYYKGHCHDINTRLKEHNAGETQSTKPFIPWVVIYYETFATLEDSIKREKYFKTASGRRFLKKVLPAYTS